MNWRQWAGAVRTVGKRLLFDATAFGANTANGLVTLPPWMTITCATTSRTTQVSASSVISGLGANAARARNVGSGWGLSIECARTNLSKQSAAAGSWTPGTQGTGTVTNADGNTDPAGTTTADQVNWTAANFSGELFCQTTSASPANTGSIWLLKNGSTTQVDLYDGAGATFTDLLSPSTSWGRFDHTSTAATVNWGVGRSNNGIAAGAVWVWGSQVESGRYPSSQIPTTTVTRTRDGDVLTAASDVVAHAGFFNLSIVLAPNFSDAQFANDVNIFYLDANNRVYLKQSDKKVYIVVNGHSTATDALTWSREDSIEVRARHSNAGQSLSVFKAGVQQGSTVTDATEKGAISLPSTAGILCDGTAALECVDLRTISLLA